MEHQNFPAGRMGITRSPAGVPIRDSIAPLSISATHRLLKSEGKLTWEKAVAVRLVKANAPLEKTPAAGQ